MHQIAKEHRRRHDHTDKVARCRKGHFVSLDSVNRGANIIRLYCSACEAHHTLWRENELAQFEGATA